jgi:hypothetical protein
MCLLQVPTLSEGSNIVASNTAFGTGTINLPKGRKLINITWKENEVWYLTRPMTESDSVETYQFTEESSWGTIEGTYNIIETK